MSIGNKGARGGQTSALSNVWRMSPIGPRVREVLGVTTYLIDNAAAVQFIHGEKT